MKKSFILVALLLFGLASLLTGCEEKKEVDGSYEFVIYASDSDNDDISDNKVVASYTITYVSSKTVTDTLIYKNGVYYFTEESKDYLVLVDGGFGLSYVRGYFNEYSLCANDKEIDLSWSKSFVNGQEAPKGIGDTPLEGLTEFSIVIDGWK